jgi:hypothetical protein
MKALYATILANVMFLSMASAQSYSFDQATGKPANIQKNKSLDFAIQANIFSNFKDDIDLKKNNLAIYNSATEIKVLKASPLLVSFVNEETDGNGCLAYFTYKTGTKPVNMNATNLKYLFPKVSSESLEYGDMVETAKINAGMSVAFIFIANAWTGKGTLNIAGNKVISTNSPKVVATALDLSSNQIVMGFETDNENGISDMNDVLITISSKENAAIKTQNIASLNVTATPITVPINTNTQDATNESTNTSNYYTCFDNGMTEDVYKSGLKTIRNTSDDIPKIKLIKASVEGFKITPDQAKEYCLQLANYKYRYEMAKFLIDFECEKDRAKILVDVIKNSKLETDYLNYLNQKINEEAAAAEAAKNAKNSPKSNSNGTNSGTQGGTQTGSNSSTVIIVDPNGGGYGQNYPSGNYPNTPGQLQLGYPMSQNDMTTLHQQLKNLSFDNEKENLAKVALMNRSLSTDQTRSILSHFTFDNNMLNTAKHLYDYCYDKQNYYTLTNSFTFMGTQRDFMNFLKSKGHTTY